MPNFTSNQLVALLYNTVGRSGEVGVLPAHQIQIAGTFNSSGVFVPVQRSGYTAGFFQWDFGQQKNGQALLDAYNAWAPASMQFSPTQQVELRSILDSDGDAIKRNQQLYLSPSDPRRKNLNTFLASDAGYQFVAGLDQQWINTSLLTKAQQAASSSTVVNMSDSDARAVIAAAVKTYNQNPTIGNAFLAALNSRTMTLQEVTDYVNNTIGNADITTGVNNTLKGVALFSRLEASTSSLGQLWQQQINADPSLAQGFSTSATAQIFDSMFRNPAAGNALLSAVEQGNKGYLIQLASKAPNETRFAGVTIDGDLFVLDRNGLGQRQFGGQWYPVINGDEKGTGILIRPARNPDGSANSRKWIIALGDGSELPIAEGDAPSLSIDGTDIALDASFGGQYAFNADGDLTHQVQNGSVWAGEILTGDRRGQTYAYIDRNLDADGSGIRKVSFNESGLPSTSDNYQLVVNDGNGGVTTIDVKPVVQSVDGAQIIVGTERTVVTELSGIRQSVSTTTVVTDPVSGSRTQTTDTTAYTSMGAFDGRTVSSTEYNLDTQTVRRISNQYDVSGDILSGSETVIPPSGPSITTNYIGANVISVAALTTFEDGSTSETTRYSDGRTIRTNRDENGLVTSRATIETTDSGSIETVTYADGHAVKLTFDKDHNLLSQEAISSGAQALTDAINQYGGKLIDALSFIKAIQSGDPLPIVTSGLRLANDIDSLDGIVDLNLAGASHVGSSVLSILSLENALQNGDTLAAITAGAQALQFGAQAYADFAFEQALEGNFEFVDAAWEAEALSESIGEAMPYLNLVNSIAHGDAVGAAMAVLSMNPATAPIAIAYTVFNIVSSLFGGDDDPPPEPWGNAWAGWSGYSTVIHSTGGEGGDATAYQTFDNVLTYLEQLAAYEQSVNPGSAIGIVANRLPSLSYRNYSGFQLTDIDPITGVQRYPEIKYDLTGRPYNAPPGSDQASQSLSERFIRVALARGAVAPMWEVETAALQTQAGDPKAGLTEEERAGRNGMLAAAVTGPEQNWRPVILDLDGDGVITTGASKTVAFDVDDSGYLKNTAWAENADGFLFLDRNLNGQIDSAKELFSNGTVALGARGLNGMAWVDSNYDGQLTAADPVWDELKVWQDADGDGVQDAGETQSLAALGITAFDYAMGRYERNGLLSEMSSPDLVADTEGTRTHIVPEGIIVETSSGHTSLLVTRIDDRTVIEANRDGFTGYEDTEAIVSGADLLANDMLGGFVGSNLTLTGVSNFTHGTGFIDANGFVHFTPAANYYGPATYTYTIQAPTGQTDTGTVDITLQNLNDAPTATVDQHTRAIYGYTSYDYSYDEWGNQYATLTSPQYAPYWGYDVSSWLWSYGYHSTPVAYEDIDGPQVGNVVPSDIDDPSGPFTYQVTAQPQMGSASIDGNGRFVYTNWYGPNTPGNDGGATSQTDSFTVRVTDPQGASTSVQVNTVHYGNYYPSLGSGGGGGKKPIAVDLGDNGFAFTDVDDSNIFFDVNGDGFKHRMAWPKADDGLLAYDADGNGTIEDGSEIAFAGYKDGAQTDLEGLSAFDSNGDGVLTAADEKWSKLGVWQDANQNGVTDAGEFKSLDELGVDSIALTSDGEFSVVDGQTVHGVAAATKADGSILDLADVTLRYSNEVLLGTQVAEKSPFSPSGEVLEGTADADLILGKTGNNLVYGYDGDDVVMEDGGNDFIDGGAGDDTIYSGADNDVVIGGEGDDLVFAGLGSDLVFGGDGHDALFAEQGNDVVFGGDGNDLIAGGSGNDVLSGDAGDDQVYGESGNDALFGRDGDDELVGMDGHDRLDGGAGNDLLDGGAGEDTMIGGAGDDVYVVDAAEDTVVEEAGGGNDTVRSTIDYALADTLENLTLAGNAGLVGLGNAADNVLIGNTGANMLAGGAGNDRLDGGAGTDLLIGGAGDDTYVVDNAGDTVMEAAGEGVDTIRASVDYALAANVENLTLTGTAAIDGTGNVLDNMLIGNTAANVLDGGAGSDTMSGGRGDDTYVVDAAGDVVVETAGEGVDTVWASVDQVLAGNVENLVLTGSAGLSGSGNSLDNVIIGNSGNNRIDGGAGADAMAGGAGDDMFIVDDAGDTVIEGEGEGIDTVEAGVSYGLAANVENLTLTGWGDISGTGNALDNRIVGNTGANLIDGGSGADTLAGVAGDDVYVVDAAGDTVLENAGEGVDTVEAGVSYGLAANVENLTLTGAAAIDGTGNELDNVLVGNDADNALSGGAGDDVLAGNGGDDWLDGGTGADAMAGGTGDDVYVVDSTVDSTLEAVDEGIDTVRASVSHGLAVDIENLVLTGAEDLAGTGNALDNTITGNGGANLIDGGEGADLMAGGAGDDTYIVDNAGDRVVEEWFGGTDKIVASVSYVLPEHVENLDLVGTADLAGTGNDLDNAIVGNAGSNVLDGATGADTMAGGMGDDVYRVDNAGDAIVENAGEGTDTVFANVSYGLAANVDNLTLVGAAAIDGSGNELDNLLVGNDSANILFGDAGSDTLTGNGGDDRLDGGAGADALFGGTGNDVYVVDDAGDGVIEAFGEGRDKVESSIDYVLTANVEDLTLTGGSDLHGTGNELDNVLTGNSGNNRLDGLAGADALFGLAGDDVYVVDNAGDLVVESLAEGLDTVESGIDYALTANVENLLLTGIADIDGTGNELDNVIVGNGGHNRLDGGSGKDTMVGGAGDDVYIVDDTEDRTVEGWDEGRETVVASASYRLMANVEDLTLTGTADLDGTGNELANLMLGNSGANALAGEAGEDRIAGNAGDDALTGGDGNDSLDGGIGNDTYVYNLGDDLDLVQDAGGVDAIEFGAGISFDTVAIRTTVADGVTTAHVRILNAGGCEMPDQGIDFVLDGSVSPIESFRFADGMVCNFDDLLIRTQYVYGTSKTPTIVTGRHDDIIYAGPAANTVYAGTGHDVVYAGPRGDTVYGQGGDDYLVGNTLNDVLDGGCGIDVLDGGVGNDTLRGGGYNNALLGNLGQDAIAGGQHNDFIAGGKQNDTIDAGAGYNVVAFNRGDGRDLVLPSAGASNTLSVGNASYADLAFRKTGNDLVLEVGGSDQITFQGWYVDAANRNFAALQMVGGKGQDGFAHEVESFDFVRLAGEFDQVRTADASASRWSLMNGLLDAHLASSDGAAIGGDLAYHYGQEGALMGMGLTSTQAVLKDASFGVQAQNVHSFDSLETGTIRLVR